MEGGVLVGEQAVFVHQETEASLLLQQSLLTAVCDEQLHVHLTACQRFQALKTNKQQIQVKFDGSKSIGLSFVVSYLRRQSCKSSHC